MGNKLEQLLNMLIQRGRKPFYGEIKNKWGVRGNYPCEGVIKIRKNTIFISYRYESSDERITKRKKVQHSIRELVAKESGLWQFVCENKMVRLDTDSGETDSYRCYYNDDGYPKDNSFEVERDDYRFRLLESSLIDESELEQFLLDNINV